MELQTIHEDRDIDFTRPGKGKEAGQRSHQMTLTISILAEPRIIFLSAGRASVLSATDEDGKLMRPLAPQVPEHFHIFAESRGKQFEEKSKLSLGRISEMARKIKVLRGTIPVQVVVERKCIALTENVLKAKGAKCRLHKGPLVITKVGQEDNGDLNIHVAVPVEPEGIRRQWFDRIYLEDAKGHHYKTLNWNISNSGGSPTEVIALTYNFSKDPKVVPPSKLVVEDWTILNYAIPFEFKDVPLP
jgi:hypothetical protein